MVECRLSKPRPRRDAPVRSAALEVKIGELAIAKAAAMKDLERQLSEHLGTSAASAPPRRRRCGSLVIKFFDLDHFDGLMSKIGFVLR